MSWITPYFVRERWDADYVNLIEGDLEHIADVYDIKITAFTTNYNEPVNQIRTKLNQLEKNITKIVSECPFPVNSYEMPIEYTDTLPRRWHLNRWVKILVELSGISATIT